MAAVWIIISLSKTDGIDRDGKLALLVLILLKLNSHDSARTGVAGGHSDADCSLSSHLSIHTFSQPFSVCDILSSFPLNNPTLTAMNNLVYSILHSFSFSLFVFLRFLK